MRLRLLASLSLSLFLLAACEEPVERPPLPAPPQDLAPEVRRRAESLRAEASKHPDERSPAYQLGLLYDAHGLARLAEACYARAAELDPRDGRARYHLGRVQAHQARFGEAAQTLKEAGRLAADYAPIHWRRGEWLLELGEAAAAEEAFRQATRVGASDPMGWVGLARCAARREEPGAVIELLQGRDGLAQVHLLRAAAYRDLGEKERASFELARAKAAPDEARDPWLLEVAETVQGLQARVDAARRAVRGGRPREAVALLREALAEESHEPNALYGLALALMASGAELEAQEALEEAIAAGRDHPRVRLALSQVHLLGGRPEEALAAAEAADALLPGSVESALQRARVLLAMERLGEARGALADARAHGGERFEVALMEGELALAFRDGAQAVRAFREAIGERPAELEAWLGACRAALFEGDARAAREALSVARSLAPNDPRVRTLAEALGAGGEGSR